MASFFLRKKISFRVQKAIEKLIPSRYLLEVKKPTVRGWKQGLAQWMLIVDKEPPL